MKISQLGTVGIIGVVVSITAACGGNPVKPAALNPVIGDGGPASAAVTLSNPKFVGPALEVCANQPPAVDLPDDFVAMCDASPIDEPPAADEPAAEEAPAADETPAAEAEPAVDEAPADIVISDTSTMDDLRSAKR